MAKKADIRRKNIVELLNQNGTMTITELSKHFDVSRETIRRDLQILRSSGNIKKWYGAVMPQNDFKILTVDRRLSQYQTQKQIIADDALKRIDQQTVIFIDAGSTALLLARKMMKLTGYTIITNSFPVINELATSNNQVISIGGKVDKLTFSAVGTQALGFLNKIKIDVSFLGTSGFAQHQGPTSNSFDDGEIKRKIIENSRLNIVLADSSKTSYSSLTSYADWHSIDYLITDDEIDDDSLKSLNEMTDVIIAKKALTIYFIRVLNLLFNFTHFFRPIASREVSYRAHKLDSLFFSLTYRQLLPPFYQLAVQSLLNKDSLL